MGAGFRCVENVGARCGSTVRIIPGQNLTHHRKFDSNDYEHGPDPLEVIHIRQGMMSPFMLI